MNKKKSCCDFFKNICKKEPQLNSDKVASGVKTSFEENIETATKIKNNEEKKTNKKNILENSVQVVESGSNSFFYDKNSILGDAIDKKKALENLKDAFGIISSPEKETTDKKSSGAKDQFTKVIKGINFKEILAGEESIIVSERSDISNNHSIVPNE
jgi:hypothetical protein